jgi:hypothetical protein
MKSFYSIRPALFSRTRVSALSTLTVEDCESLVADLHILINTKGASRGAESAATAPWSSLVGSLSPASREENAQVDACTYVLENLHKLPQSAYMSSSGRATASVATVLTKLGGMSGGVGGIPIHTVIGPGQILEMPLELVDESVGEYAHTHADCHPSVPLLFSGSSRLVLRSTCLVKCLDLTV